MQPVVTTAVEDRVAVPPPPAPATSPVAVKNADVAVFVAVAFGCPTKCRPPSRVVDVGPTASAGTTAIAVTMRDNTAIIPSFLNI